MKLKLVTFSVEPNDNYNSKVDDITNRLNLNELLEDGWIIKTFTTIPHIVSGSRTDYIWVTLLLERED